MEKNINEKEARSEIHEFDPVIYPYKLWIVIDRNPNIITDEFNEYSGNAIEGLNKDTKGYAAFAMPVMRKKDDMLGVVLFFYSKRIMTFEIVAHESSHAAKYLFEHIGADIKEHEPFEYVVGWVAKCCETVKRIQQ